MRAGRRSPGSGSRSSGPGAAPEQKSFRAVLDRFEQETGTTVAYTSAGDDVAPTLTARVADGDPPDLAMVPQPGLLAELAAQGALVAIDDAAGATVDANYASIWRTLGSVDGTLYGVWFKAADKSLWWYDAPAFGRAGVRPPATLDGLQERHRHARRRRGHAVVRRWRRRVDADRPVREPLPGNGRTGAVRPARAP